MNRNSGLWLLALTAVAVSYAPSSSAAAVASRLSDGAQAQQTSASSSPISCAPEKPLVTAKESIQVRVWAAQSSSSSKYTWTVTGGHIEGQGVEVRWDFTGVEPGYYTATVRNADGGTGSETCAVQVVVQESPGSRGGLRESGHDLLVKDGPEREGYGLYSYVLLGGAPEKNDKNAQERYLKVMEAFLQLVPVIAELEKYFDKRQLNITYVPVDASPDAPPTAQWLLQHYDYARARFLMHGLPGTHPSGPYLVSSLKPLSGAESGCGPCLFQNLSSVPSHLVFAWMGEFLNQAAQEHFWEENSGKKLLLRIRTTIGILAAGLPDVRKGLDDWIAWTH